MPYKDDHRARPETLVHVVRVQFAGCLPEHSSFYGTWREAQDALRDEAEYQGCTERSGRYRYDDPERPYYIVHDTCRIRDTGLEPRDGETVGDWLTRANNA